MRVPMDKKQLRQKRIMTYFIDAADQIIKDEGVGAVTIRKVSDLAGYNSATLYNYFDNLNHLIFLATMNHLEAYNASIPACIQGCKNSLEIYLSISECFCKYSFASPEIYELLFFTNRDNKLEEYTQQYYALFPEREREDGGPVKRLIHVNDIYSRSALMLSDCVADGFMTQQGAEDFNDVAMMIYKSVLQDVKDERIDKQVACAKTMRYYRQILSCYTKRQFHSLLETED